MMKMSEFKKASEEYLIRLLKDLQPVTIEDLAKKAGFKKSTVEVIVRENPHAIKDSRMKNYLRFDEYWRYREHLPKHHEEVIEKAKELGEFTVTDMRKAVSYEISPQKIANILSVDSRVEKIGQNRKCSVWRHVNERREG